MNGDDDGQNVCNSKGHDGLNGLCLCTYISANIVFTPSVEMYTVQYTLDRATGIVHFDSLTPCCNKQYYVWSKTQYVRI